MNLDNLFRITEADWYKIISWAQLAYDKDKNEISGLATAVPNDAGLYVISDIEILKQENSGTNTELDADSVTEYKMKYALKHKNPNMKYVWWHSHHTMGAFWSGTDEKEIDAWKNESFSLALVVNLKEEYKFRVSVWKAGGLELEQHYDIPLNIIRDKGIDVNEDMVKQYKELCEDKHANILPFNRNYTNYNNYLKKPNINQNHLWQKPTNLNIGDLEFYSKTITTIEESIDKVMSEEIPISKFKKNMKSLQKHFNKNGISDYKVVMPQGDKQNILDVLSRVFPHELLEFKDEIVKNAYDEGDYYNGWYQ